MGTQNYKKVNVGYHITTGAALSSILKEGILPAIGPRSKLLGEKKPAIYFFSSLKDVENGLMNWVGDVFDETEKLYVIECNLKGRNAIKKDGQFEVISTEKIDPSLIKAIYTEDLELWKKPVAAKRAQVAKKTIALAREYFTPTYTATHQFSLI